MPRLSCDTCCFLILCCGATAAASCGGLEPGIQVTFDRDLSTLQWDHDQLGWVCLMCSNGWSGGDKRTVHESFIRESGRCFFSTEFSNLITPAAAVLEYVESTSEKIEREAREARAGYCSGLTPGKHVTFSMDSKDYEVARTSRDTDDEMKGGVWGKTLTFNSGSKWVVRTSKRLPSGRCWFSTTTHL